jgi:hypothetical protein
VTCTGYRVVRIWQRRSDAAAALEAAARAMCCRRARSRAVAAFVLWRRAHRSSAANARRSVVAVWPHRYCPPRHSTAIISRNDGSI